MDTNLDHAPTQEESQHVFFRYQKWFIIGAIAVLIGVGYAAYSVGKNNALLELKNDMYRSISPYPTEVITPSPTVISTVRPADPIIDGVNKLYHNEKFGMEFKYPKEWIVISEKITPITNVPNDSYESVLELGINKFSNLKLRIVHLPYLDGFIDVSGLISETDVIIDSYPAKIKVYQQCNVAALKDCLNNDEWKKEITSSFVVELIKKKPLSWIKNDLIEKDFWTIGYTENSPIDQVGLEQGLNKLKNIISTIKFLE